MKHKILTVMFAVLASSPVLADHDTEGSIDTIIVTATRSEIPLSDAIIPVKVISRQQIEQSMAADLADLLRFYAGLDLGRNGGPGQSASIFLRGAESNHTLVMIDGVRINPGTIGGAAIQNIPPELIERIEIVKGPRSALFGSDAIGGVINILTRRSAGTPSEMRLGGGSFNTRSAFLTTGTTVADTELGASINWQQTDGFSPLAASDLKRGYDNLSANVYAKKEIGEAVLGFRHWQASGNTEYLDFFLSPVDQDFRNESTAIEWQAPLGGLLSKATISHMVDEIDQRQSADFVESSRLALDWQVSNELGNHAIVGGLYLMRESANVLSWGSGFDEDTSVRAVFIEDHWRGGNNALLAAVRLTDHETFGNEITWNVEYSRNLADRLRFTMGAGHAFRAPDATDRYGFGGSPLLRPEIADEAQLGFSYQPGHGQTVTLDFYHKTIDDLIEFDWATFELQNIEAARIRGVQLAYTYTGDAFTFNAEALRQKARNESGDMRLLRRAEKSLSLSLLRTIGDYSLGVNVLASGDREDFGGYRMPGYVLTNLTARLRVDMNWMVGVRLQNIFDVDYETAAGFNAEDKSVYVDLSYRWN
jgi:vitamin B12 transporter